jgi:hypothetical protein
MVATYARCQKILDADAPVELRDRFTPGLRRLLADLGISSTHDLEDRTEQVRSFLPRVWDVAEAIMAVNPAIAGYGARTTPALRLGIWQQALSLQVGQVVCRQRGIRVGDD